MAGIAGFINGVFQGMDWREGREDRARVRKMQDEEFGWRREDQEWQREDRDFTRSERDYARSERERQRKEREAELAAWNEYADELTGKTAGVPANTATVAIPRPENTYVGNGNLSFSTKSAQPQTQPATRPQQRPEMSLGQIAAMDAPRPQAMTDAPTLAQPAAQPPLVYRTPDGTQYEMGMSLNDAVRSLGPDAVGYRQGQIDPRLARAAGVGAAAPIPPVAAQPNAPIRQIVPNMPMPRAPMVQTAGPGPTGRIDPALYDQGILPRRFVEDPMAAPAPRRAVQGPPVQFTGPAMPPNPDTGELPPPSIGGPIPSLPAGMTPSRNFSRPAQTPPAKQPVEAAPKTEQGTPMASVQTVAELSFGLIGENGVVKTTPQRIERTVAAAEKEYRQNKVPSIVEHYIRTGQPEKAEAFEKWVNDKGVREGMRAWQKSILAVQANDGDGFLNGLADAYEANNYYDDGLSVVREKSDVSYDERGNIVGAQVTFKDDATGREFTQNFSDIEDFVATAIGVMAPESAFDKAWEMAFGNKESGYMDFDTAITKINEEADTAAKSLLGDTKPMTEEEKARRFDAYTGGRFRNPFEGAGSSASGVGGSYTLY